MNKSSTAHKADNPWLQFSKNLPEYKTPDHRMAVWQLVNSVVPYIGLWVLIIATLSEPWWVTAILIVAASAFLVRVFTLFHDCGHGSFFKSKKINRRVGVILGILTFTPYSPWHRQHLIHHSTVGNLDKRGTGDIWTMTKKEYQASSKRKRLMYRLYRNPIVMFGLGPFGLFLFSNRFTEKWMTPQEKKDVYITNAGLLVMFAGMSLIMGILNYLLIQLIIIQLTAMAGIWLFYLQHQFEDVVWYRNNEWKYQEVALHGSSFVKFPPLLRWFTGNIGYHHIHHLNSSIPNYKLVQCYRENKVLQEVKPVTFLASLRTLRLRLWDEHHERLVPFN